MNPIAARFDERLARKRQDERRAATAGAGVVGGLTAADAVREYARDASEAKSVKRSRSYADLLKKLEPGDIAFTRFASKQSPLMELGGKEIPIRAKDLVTMGTGSPYYHGQIYLGGGKVGQAGGLDQPYAVNKTYDDWSGQDVKVYRPTKASSAERKAALKFVQDARGTPYPSNAENLKQGLMNFLGVSPSSAGGKCRIGPTGALNCTTSVTSAYPEQFPKLHMTPDEMRAAEGMELVGRYGRAGKLTPYEHLISRALHPALKNLKWGALAGLGAYGLSRAAGAIGGDDDR